MLYISRLVWQDNSVDKYSPVHGFQSIRCYGVVDTDDNVEEVITRDDLEEAVRRRDIDIAGVTMLGLQRLIIDVIPYQPKPSPLQMKTLMIHHVNVIVFNSCITNITWRRDKIGKNACLRLSDFGDSCADFILYGNMSLVSGDQITLVLDDKIKSITDHSFRLDTSERELVQLDATQVNGLGVRFDLRELHNNDIAASFYRQLFSYKGNILDFVDDSSERKLEMLKLYGGLIQV